MNIINTYGLSAGPIVSRDTDDDADKFRKDAKRRAEAAHLAQRARLNIRLRQVNEQAVQQAADRLSELTQQNSPVAKEPNSKEPSLSLKWPAENSQLEASSLASEEESQVARMNLSDPFSAASQQQNRARAQAHNTRSAPPLLKKETSSPQMNIRSVDGALPEISDQTRAPSEKRTETLLDRLLAQIQRSSGMPTRDRSLALLEQLKQDMEAQDLAQISREDRECVLGYLEFLTGYFEMGDKGAAPSQQITALMAEIRTQLSAVTDPLRVTVAQQISVAHRAENLTALQGVGREQRKPKARSVEEALDEVEQGGAQVDASALVMNSVRATGTMPATPPSSLSKDTERRRDETPVSVTIRSV